MGRNLWHSESMLCLAALAAHGVGVAGPHQHPALQAFPACAWPAEGGVRGGSLSASNRRSCTGIEPPCFARSCSTPPFGNVYNPGVREPPPGIITVIRHNSQPFTSFFSTHIRPDMEAYCYEALSFRYSKLTTLPVSSGLYIPALSSCHDFRLVVGFRHDMRYHADGLASRQM